MKSALLGCKEEDMRPALAIVFAPAEEHVQFLSELFTQNGIIIFGISSFGQFIDYEFDTDSIVVMLLEIDRHTFKIEFRETGESTTKEIAKSIGHAGKATFAKPTFVVASGGATRRLYSLDFYYNA
ncbi:MAG TPA: hypothetical protein VKR32_18210 [Puia sp.]|nr:hypothetical protein [Puia sp.]